MRNLILNSATYSGDVNTNFLVTHDLDLNYLEKLVFASHKYDNFENERKSYANKLAFGY
jgi:hypothetical protein